MACCTLIIQSVSQYLQDTLQPCVPALGFSGSCVRQTLSKPGTVCWNDGFMTVMEETNHMVEPSAGKAGHLPDRRVWRVLRE